MPSSMQFAEGSVCGFLHRPDNGSERGLVLTHGAGGNCRAPLLIATAEAFSEARFAVLRCDLLFRQRRPTGPPSAAGAAADRAGLKDAVASMRHIVAGPIFLGGQSYGGRQTTLLASAEPQLVSGLLLFSYPLHPPGQPERLRTEHFPLLRVPALFVQGTADPFGTVAELRHAIAVIPAPTHLLSIDGAGHDLRRGRFDAATVVATFLKLIERSS
ncbi:MAG: alpha/beta hydrolase [Alphaproteobacteria bacterium]|nr:alpha/beta hydrolase [Alphaproteobacteria bacterium]